MLESLKCRSNGSLQDALQLINSNAKRLAFVVEEDATLIGVLTDGDIRRLLLEGITLDASVAVHANQNCVKAYQHESLQEMLAKISDRVTVLPILNDEGKLVDFFQYENRVHIPVAAPDLKGNEFKYLVDAFLSTWISSSGSYINKFEEGFAEFCECEHGVAVSNGTVALHLALVALGVGPGDEVIIPDLTFAATINAVIHAGATPIIVDVEMESWCIDPLEIKKAITDKTKAIIPVHLYGQPCNMSAIMAIANQHNLFVIEDCAEAHGATFEGQKVGSFGHISTFSFYGNKVITTGEGGMCVTNSEQLDKRMRVLRDHGMSKEKRYWHEEVGFNYRMTNLQAAIGVAQLERIDEILSFRASIEAKYVEMLSGYDFIKFQPKIKGRNRIVWLVSVLVDGTDRDELISKLKEVKIDARPFFYSMGEMPIYSEYVFSNKNSLKLAAAGVSFPTSSEITEAVSERITRVFSLVK
ncbi:MAG: aminotransferase class I/II-fold pyridoxal phosphate-dependent enzyme [Flavobacteriales bacterium]